MAEETTTIKFNGCKYLDFDIFYSFYSAKRQLTPNGLFWMRESQPSMVQFCKKKGRIYGCESCLSEGNKQCNDYKEIEHSVDVPIQELES